MTTITRSLDEIKAELAHGHTLRAAAALDSLVYETWDPEELKEIDALAAPNGDRRRLLTRVFCSDAHKEARLRIVHPDYRPEEFHPAEIFRWPKR